MFVIYALFEFFEQLSLWIFSDFSKFTADHLSVFCFTGSVRRPVHAARRLPDDGEAGGREPGEPGGHQVQKHRVAPQPRPAHQVSNTLA